jgi:hypothetical protein
MNQKQTPDMPPTFPFSSGWSTITAAVILSVLGSVGPSWSQSDGNSNTSSLPPLPHTKTAGGPESNILPSLGSNTTHSPPNNAYAPSQPRNGSVMVVGQSNAAATGSHLMSSATLSNGSQQIVLVDPAKMTLAVYHIEPNKGDVQLKSVRRMDADFALEEFNLSEPTPTTIRKNLRNLPDRH